VPTTVRRERLQLLDVIRGMALVGVLAFHGLATTYHGHGRPPFYLWPLGAGKLGVDAFFVLSGFVITRSWGSRPTDLSTSRAFMSRRIKRLFPAYWASLVVYVALRARHLLHTAHGIGTIVLHLMGQQFLLPNAAYQINSVYWTLTPQIHFYLLFPLLILAMRKLRARSTLIVILVMSIGFRVLLHTTNQWPADTILGRLDQFALGMAAALAVGRSNRILNVLRSKTVATISVVALAVLIVAFGSTWMGPSHTQQVLAETLGHPLFAVLLAVRLLRIPEHSSTSIATTTFAGLGTISYSVYLWHLPIFEWASGAGLAGIVAATIASLVVGTVSYFVLERPSFGRRSVRKDAARRDVRVGRERDDAYRQSGPRRLDDLVRAGVDGLVYHGPARVRDEEEISRPNVA
jgi:peptidoglycan/LPS O-acetylase OafA/YrhL